MKIGIISRPRTVSSAVTNSLATKYKLFNGFENYCMPAQTMALPNSKISNLSDDEKKLNFENLILDITNDFFSKGNFICKIWPCFFVYHAYLMLPNWSLDSVKKKTVFDITRLFKLDQYDQLYFLDKDIYYTTASWIYSKKIQMMHTFKGIRHSTPVLTLTQLDYGIAKFHVLEYFLHQKVKQMLTVKNIPFSDISDTYNDYIDESSLDTVKSNHEYKSLISDYDNLMKCVTEWKQEFSTQTSDWQFT